MTHKPRVKYYNQHVVYFQGSVKASQHIVHSAVIAMRLLNIGLYQSQIAL
jgi:hypothetical protein